MVVPYFVPALLILPLIQSLHKYMSESNKKPSLPKKSNLPEDQLIFSVSKAMEFYRFREGTICNEKLAEIMPILLLSGMALSPENRLRNKYTELNSSNNQSTHLLSKVTKPENFTELDVYNKKLIQLLPEERFSELGKSDNSFEYDIFICHSSKDNTLIEALIKDLRKEKITYWVDTEQITYGDPITKKIEDGLKKSRYIIPCLSKNLNTSGWTIAEYGSILNAELSGNFKRRVIPLKLDNCENDDIPLLLRDIRRVKYSNKDEFNRFIEFLKR